MGTVLVVDDEPGIQRFVRRALEADGHRVLVAWDGLEGLRLAVAHAAPVVLLDLGLPGLSGQAVLAALVTDSPQRAVLVMSAAADDVVAARCREVGAVDVLAKPFPVAAMVARVRHWTQHVPGGGPPPPHPGAKVSRISSA